MTRAAALALCAMAILADAASSASLARGLGADRPPARTYILGRDGWSLERFGDHVAILRTSVNAPADQSAPAGLLVLSCDAGERRWRLSLPEPLTGGRASATLLLRPPSPSGAYLVETVRIAQGRVLTSAEMGPFERGLVPFFVRLLKAGEPRIDLLLGSGSAKSAAALAVVVLIPTLQRTDLVAFDDFLASCAARKT